MSGISDISHWTQRGHNKSEHVSLRYLMSGHRLRLIKSEQSLSSCVTDVWSCSTLIVSSLSSCVTDVWSCSDLLCPLWVHVSLCSCGLMSGTPDISSHELIESLSLSSRHQLHITDKSGVELKTYCVLQTSSEHRPVHNKSVTDTCLEDTIQTCYTWLRHISLNCVHV